MPHPNRFPDPEVDRAQRAAEAYREATAGDNEKRLGQALQRATDALRKIRLGHPCDVHELIAANAIEEIEGMLA